MTDIAQSGLDMLNVSSSPFHPKRDIGSLGFPTRIRARRNRDEPVVADS
jgi:hypothetical protein